MGVNVPSNYVWWVKEASAKTHMPYQVVACQINLESGFNPGAVSPAGAEGIAQFLPSTFASYAHGSPFNVNDALTAYINFMNFLLRGQFGNLRNALAAYNAGPGNIPAGWGYADEILSCAGQGINITPVALAAIGNPLQLPQGGGSNDDWSQKIRNCADQVHFAGTNMLSAGKAIRSL